MDNGATDNKSIEDTPIEALDDFLARIAPDFNHFRPPFVSKFGALTLDHLDDPGPEHDWLVEGWLSVGDKSVIGGPSGSGKSFLAIHAGLCIATGRDFFGAAVKQGLVIYQAGEGARGVKKRLRAWRSHFGVQFEAKTPFVLLQNKVDLYHDVDTPVLIAEINAIAAMYDCPLRAVFFDTFATAAVGAEENSAKDIGMVMANVARINSETKAHVGLVHHMNADATKLRGSTAINANIDQTITVKKNETTGVRTVALPKQRDDDSNVSFQFELPRVEVAGFDSKGRPNTSCVCVAVGEKEAVRRTEEAKGWKLADPEIIFMKAFFQAEKKHGQPVPPDFDIPAAVRSIVPYEDVKRAYGQLSPSDETEAPPADSGDAADDAEKAGTRHRAALKKRLQRTREALQRWGVIGVKESKGVHFVWWTGKPLRAFPHTIPREDRDVDPGPQPSLDGVDLSEVPF